MISFVICTNGKKVELTKLTIQSIFNTVGDKADIHLGGVITDFLELGSKINLHDFSYEANNGYVGALRNKTIEQTQGDIIVYCDDDVLYPSNWYKKFLDYGTDWNIMSNKIYLPNGGRYWDRAIVDYDTHTMVDYDHDKNDHRLFFCATWFAIKKDCFKNNKFDPELLYYGGYKDKNLPVEKWKTAEDLELSRRLYENGYIIDFDSNNHVYHAAWNFSQVIRKHNNNYKNVCVLSGVLVAEEETSETIRKLSIKQEFDM
jgi:glycosyltransferase involved in cell wall biosynthesis